MLIYQRVVSEVPCHSGCLRKKQQGFKAPKKAPGWQEKWPASWLQVGTSKIAAREKQDQGEHENCVLGFLASVWYRSFVHSTFFWSIYQLRGHVRKNNEATWSYCVNMVCRLLKQPSFSISRMQNFGTSRYYHAKPNPSLTTPLPLHFHAYTNAAMY